MRLYDLAVLLGLAGAGMLAAAAVIAYNADTTPAGSPAGVVPASERGGDVWGASYFPNVELVTHEGETVRFFDDLIEGRVVALNFLYTSCPDTCPVQTSRMLQVARLLEDRLGDDVFFYSITIDPDYDTQPVLAEFAESWNIPDGWKFLTGAEEDIVLLRRKLGMRLDDVESGDLADHSVNILIGNQATGRWMKRSPFENPYVLADQLGSWLHGWKRAGGTERDYADAPEIRQISDGEYIFRNRCSACHTIGGGDVREADSRAIGPDLFGVTDRRERQWLERWLMEPDAMIEEGDPLAVELYEQWNRIPMPNLRLTEKDVDALVGYMARTSRKIRDARAGRLADHSGHGNPPEHGDHAEHREHADHADPAEHRDPMDHGEPMDHGDHAERGEQGAATGGGG